MMKPALAVMRKAFRLLLTCAMVRWSSTSDSGHESYGRPERVSWSSIYGRLGGDTAGHSSCPAGGRSRRSGHGSPLAFP